MPLHGDEIVIALRAGTETRQESYEVRPFKRRRLSNGQTVSASLSTPGAESSTSSGHPNSYTRKTHKDVVHLTGDIPEFPVKQIERTPESDVVAGRLLLHVQLYRPSLPDSTFSGSISPKPLLLEAEVIDRLFATSPESEDGYTYFELNDFTVYKPYGRMRGLDMVCLDKLQVKTGASSNETFCFDGTLSVGDHEYAVQNMPFSILAVDGYGDNECLDLSGRLAVQTLRASRRDIWYRLGKPSKEYARFHEPYLWLATFTKFFVDFLSEHDEVNLAHFRADFFMWMQCRHRKNAVFQEWHEKCGLQDFCTTVVAHVGYLYKECYGVDREELSLLQHPIWSEAHFDCLDAIKEQKNTQHDTVVTPLVHDMFKSMYFSKKMRVVAPSSEVADSMASRKRTLGLTPSDALPTETPRSLRLFDSQDLDDIGIRRGTVIAIKPDSSGKWRKSLSRYWYAYVQDVRAVKSGLVLDVLYLYEPCDTTLGSAYYPFQNELFLSDNCACNKDAIPLEEVVGTINVDWFITDPNSVAVSSYFVRQKFRTDQENDTNDFVTLGETDFSCQCETNTSPWLECLNSYNLNDTVLVKQPDKRSGEILVPARIIQFVRQERKVSVKLLCAVEAGFGPANELVESSQLLTVAPDSVVRKCDVAHFQSRDQIHQPFNRGGRGGFYYMLCKQRPAWLKMHSWHRATAGKAPLKGLGLFCGGGNFDRGLEESGAVKIAYAVDWATHALHSYRANVEKPETTRYFLGSVNDYLFKALKGSTDVEIARVNGIEFISAGSPCPGFSRMQIDLGSDDSLRNASMVASVVAHVDLYSPEYLMLENVVTMTQGMGAKKDKNVFAQVLAALVALGYQVRQSLVDSWSQGSCQQRSRVFIIASAPGCKPLKDLVHSHDHPINRTFYKRALGKATNGLTFGVRRDHVCPFPHNSPQAATAELPDIGDSMPQICIPFPDHRTVTNESFESRERVARIPLYPYGTGLAQAIGNAPGSYDAVAAGEEALGDGTITSGEAYAYLKRCSIVRNNRKSHSYSRVHPDGLIPTVLTAVHLACGKSGRSLHWVQPRTLSVLEYRRAQGFLDHEVIIGTPQQQMKIIGNSVDRHAATALGLALREAWLARWEDEDEQSGELVEESQLESRQEPKKELTGASSVEKKQEQLSAVTGNPRSLPVNEDQAIAASMDVVEEVEFQGSFTLRQSEVIRQTLDDELAQDDVEGRYMVSSPAIRRLSLNASATAISNSKKYLVDEEVIVTDDSSSDEADTPIEHAATGSNGLLTPARDL